MSLLAAYQREAEDAVADSYAVAIINGLAFDRHAEERTIQVFTQALRAATEEFLADPLGPPLVPNWSRVWAGVPDAGARLLAAVEKRRRLREAGVAMSRVVAGGDRPRRDASRPRDLRLRRRPARRLDALRRAGVPLVLCSSKTRAEMEPLAAAIGATGPLVVENGGAIVDAGRRRPRPRRDRGTGSSRSCPRWRATRASG